MSFLVEHQRMVQAPGRPAELRCSALERVRCDERAHIVATRKPSNPALVLRFTVSAVCIRSNAILHRAAGATFWRSSPWSPITRAARECILDPSPCGTPEVPFSPSLHRVLGALLLVRTFQSLLGQELRLEREKAWEMYSSLAVFQGAFTASLPKAQAPSMDLGPANAKKTLSPRRWT